MSSRGNLVEGAHWTFLKEAEEEMAPFLSRSTSGFHLASLSEVVEIVTFHHTEALPHGFCLAPLPSLTAGGQC